MERKQFTYYPDFTFIVKKPGVAKCEVVKRNVLLTHLTDDSYHDFFRQYDGSLFCSSADNDFEEVLKLYNSPVSFDCIAIDRIELDPNNLNWLADELLEEVKKTYEDEDEKFFDLFFL